MTLQLYAFFSVLDKKRRIHREKRKKTVHLQGEWGEPVDEI